MAPRQCGLNFLTRLPADGLAMHDYELHPVKVAIFQPETDDPVVACSNVNNANN